MDRHEFLKLVTPIAELVEKKGGDYQNKVTLEQYFPFGAKSYIHMLNTKTLRLISLADKAEEPTFESMTDSVYDLIAYATFFVKHLEAPKQAPKPRLLLSEASRTANMSNFESSYCTLVSEVIADGDIRETRAGPTKSIFGAVLQIDSLEHGYFPILTQRKIFIAGILGELAAFLRGTVDLATFKEFGCNYWDANAKVWAPNKGKDLDKQSVGKIYGYQWRNWMDTHDQLATLVRGLIKDPSSRRHLLTTHNPAQLDEMCLPPCHLLAQYNVRNSTHLDCIVYMRSVDLCLGLPSDVILYATLLLILCQETGYIPGKLTFMLGDTHIYKNHIEQFQVYAKQERYALPTYELQKTTLNSFVPKDLRLINYKHSGVVNYEFFT